MPSFGLQTGLGGYTSVLFTNHSDFRDTLWVCLALGVGINIQTGMLSQD